MQPCVIYHLRGTQKTEIDAIKRFSIEFRLTKTIVGRKNQSELKAESCDRSQARENLGN